jgi:hypothetical protein
MLAGCTLTLGCQPAFALGTWFTSKAAWLAAVNNVRTDTFSDSLGRGRILNRLGGDLQIWETGTDTDHLYSGINNVGDRFISVSQTSNIMNLSFTSFAFGGMFAVVDEGDYMLGTSLMITTSDGTSQPLKTSSSEGVFWGYVGDAPISWMTIEQPEGNGYVALNSFSLARPAGELSVSGANVAPEPDTRRLIIVGSGIGFTILAWKRKRLRFYRWTLSNTNSRVA